MIENSSNSCFSHVSNYFWSLAGYSSDFNTDDVLPVAEEVKPPSDSPLHRIARAIAPILNETGELQVWRNSDAQNFRSMPPIGLATKRWHPMSTWKTILTIGDLMIESQSLTSLLPADKSSLKTYLIRVARDNGGFFSTFWSCVLHGLKGEGWVSTAAKAAKLLGRLKNRGSDYWVAFEDLWNPGDSPEESGRSRIYKVKKDEYCDLSKQHKGIGFINGIHNTINYAQGSAKYIAELAGANITAIYNAKHGLFADLTESWYGWWGIKTKPANKVKKMWDAFFDNQPSNARFLMFCHSQGAVHVKNALANYPEKRRKRIEIVAIAPGVYIDPAMCGKVRTYRVRWYRDPIPRIDLRAAWNFALHRITPGTNKTTFKAYKRTIKTLSSDPRGEYIDHSFRSLTYAPKIAKHLIKFVNKKL